MKYQLKINGKTYQVERKQDGFYCEGKKLQVESNNISRNDFVVTEESHHFKIDNEFYFASLTKENAGSTDLKNASGVIVSPMNGTINSVDCQIKDKVKKGDKLLTIEAMKMLYPIYADKDGIITTLSLSKGMTIKSNQILVKIE